MASKGLPWLGSPPAFWCWFRHQSLAAGWAAILPTTGAIAASLGSALLATATRPALWPVASPPARTTARSATGAYAGAVILPTTRSVAGATPTLGSAALLPATGLSTTGPALGARAHASLWTTATRSPSATAAPAAVGRGWWGWAAIAVPVSITAASTPIHATAWWRPATARQRGKQAQGGQAQDYALHDGCSP
ncbi:hypothetical protein [Acetobacter vaccinii]|uniref:hypothetical protein n=1 Tax=Acetobacter vaccinii TaxID=2592655 RepID=UPI00143E0E67|nr:hypothetical protein [Acetobacter vaccinii]